jgi:DNA primase
MCFDADAAGARAVERGTETMRQIAEGIGIELRVITVPDGKDPDECLRGAGHNAGPIAFQSAISKAPLLIDYQLESAITGVDIKSHGGRIEAAQLLVPHLSLVGNAVARGEYVRQWSSRLGIREEELLTDVGQWRRQHRSGVSNLRASQDLKIAAASRNSPKSGYIEAERQLLALYFTSMDDHQAVLATLAEDTLIEPAHQRIKEAIEGIGKVHNIEDFQFCLMDRLGPDPEAGKLLVDVLLKAEEVQRQKMPRAVILKEARTRILREKILSMIGKLRSRLPVAASEEEQEVLQSKIMQLKQLEPKVLPCADNEDHLVELQRKIDSLLLETTP